MRTAFKSRLQRLENLENVAFLSPEKIVDGMERLDNGDDLGNLRPDIADRLRILHALLVSARANV